MKTWTITADGVLELESWSFGNRNNDPPHRCSVLCSAKAPRAEGDKREAPEIKLCTNIRRNVWWLVGSCDGFAGAHSRAINSVCTHSVKVYQQWRSAIEAGKVKIVCR